MGVSPSQTEVTRHSSLPHLQAGPRKTNIGKEAVSELRTQVIQLLSKRIQGLNGISKELILLLDEEFLTQMLVNLSMQAGLLHLDKSSIEYKGQSEMVVQAVMQQVLSETLLPPFYRYFAVKVRFIDTIEEALDEQATQFAENYQEILRDVEAYRRFCQDFFLIVFGHIHTHDRTDDKLICFAVASAFFNPQIKSPANSQVSKMSKSFVFDFFRLFVRAHASFENDLKVKLPGLKSPEILTSQQIHKILKKSSFLQQAQEQIKKITAVTQRTNFLKTILILYELIEKYYELAQIVKDGNTIESASQRVYLSIHFIYCFHAPGMYSLCSFVHEYLGFILPPDVSHRLTLINMSYMQIKQYFDSPESYQNIEKKEFRENRTQELALQSSPLNKEQISPISEVSTLETDNSSKKNDSPFNFGDTPVGKQSKLGIIDEDIPQTRCFSV